MDDPQDFQTILSFLGEAHDVTGQSHSAPPEPYLQQLKQLVQGGLSEEERTSLFRFLKANPQWVGLLAEEIRALPED